MAKYNFDTIQDFVDYVEQYFSKSRSRNTGDDSFEISQIARAGDVAFLRFDVNPDFDAMAVLVRVPAQNEWVGFFPKFSHEGLAELPRLLGEVNNDNHDNCPERHPPSEEKRMEEMIGGLEWTDYEGP